MDDLISRQAVIDAVDSETVITNPEHFKSNEKFIKFMDDSDISSFGKWQWANGFNTALVATRIHLKKLPSAQPVTHEERTKTHACDLISRQAAIDVEGLDEQIRCEMCRNPMHTNRGCDGNCQYDEKLYERIMQILGERIKPLPSASPDLSTFSDKLWKIAYERGKEEGRKKGKWIDKSDDIEGAWNYCSVCMEQAIDLYDFCPNCGADMREGE